MHDLISKTRAGSPYEGAVGSSLTIIPAWGLRLGKQPLAHA